MSGRMMSVLAVASQKGGCGKSLLAVHLAVEAMCTGKRSVLLVDIDPQESAFDCVQRHCW